MLRKSAFFGLALVLLTAACTGNGGGGDTYTGERPKTVCMVRTTPVKDCAGSPTDWLYAMLATIETEHLLVEDSVNLSPLFLERMLLEEECQRIYLSGGQAAMNLRGLPGDAIVLMNRRGVTHYDAFHGTVNREVLTRKLEIAARQHGRRHAGMQAMMDATSKLMDDSLHPAQTAVFWMGAEYTPQEFAHSVCMPDEYMALTSVAYAPFGQKISLPVGDSRTGEIFINQPLDKLMEQVENAIATGHGVCWTGEAGEPLFSWQQGMAMLADERNTVTQEQRQQALDRRPDGALHSLELVGLARTADGRKWFVAKDARGTGNALGGMVCMSENYLRAKTLAVWMSWKAYFKEDNKPKTTGITAVD